MKAALEASYHAGEATEPDWVREERALHKVDDGMARDVKSEATKSCNLRLLSQPQLGMVMSTFTPEIESDRVMMTLFRVVQQCGDKRITTKKTADGETPVSLETLGTHGCWFIMKTIKKYRGQAIRMCRVDRSSARPKMKNKTISLRRYWNKAHSKYRSRIERTYAWWLKYACTTQCDKGPEFLKDAFTIMIAWEFFLQQTKGQGHYAKELPSSHDWSTDTWCNCGVYKDPVAARNACSKRRSNAQHLKNLHLVPVPRSPKHRAKDHKLTLLWPMNPPSESDTASSASGDEDER